MKKYVTLFCFLVVFGQSQAQEIEKDLKTFYKVIASPHINVVLTKGEKESIRLVYNDVNASKINIEVNGKTLHIYLDDAKSIEKRENYKNNHGYRYGIYEGVSITAYVTYKELRQVEIRGNQELTCMSPIETDVFMLKAYGENEITLTSLKTGYFKASLYGENKLKIRDGKVMEQHYKLYGDNKIYTSEMKSAYTSTSIFGEGELNVYSSKEIRINAFGEPNITVTGDGNIHKRLVIGQINIHRN